MADRRKEALEYLEIDGEMQADTAVDPARLAAIYPFSHLKGAANVLIFSRLSAANAAYKLLDTLGGADAIGPVLSWACASRSTSCNGTARCRTS